MEFLYARSGVEGWAHNDFDSEGSHTHQKFRECCRLVAEYFHVISQKTGIRFASLIELTKGVHNE